MKSTVQKSPRESFYSFIIRINRYCYANCISLIYLNTIRDFRFLFIDFKLKVVSHIHNVNWWFKNNESPSSYCKSVFRSLGFLLEKDPLINPVTGPLLRWYILFRSEMIVFSSVSEGAILQGW